MIRNNLEKRHISFDTRVPKVLCLAWGILLLFFFDFFRAIYLPLKRNKCGQFSLQSFGIFWKPPGFCISSRILSCNHSRCLCDHCLMAHSLDLGICFLQLSCPVAIIENLFLKCLLRNALKCFLFIVGKEMNC